MLTGPKEEEENEFGKYVYHIGMSIYNFVLCLTPPIGYCCRNKL
jgi:hypothetical protein